MVSKIRNVETIGTSTKYDGGITALSLDVKNFMFFIDISFASRILSIGSEQILCQIRLKIKNEGQPLTL